MPALDGVRGLAILLVLVDHFIGNARATNAVERAVFWVASYGYLGVCLFFVLSGFLITGILYDSRSSPRYFTNFYMRRVLRIFPLYYGVLFAVLVVLPFLPSFRDSATLTELRAHQIWAWLYGINVYIFLEGKWVLSYIEHFWSLCVEEHFYFVWPLVVYAFARRPRALLNIALGLAAFSVVLRVVSSIQGVSPTSLYVFTPFHFDALCLGAFLAVYARQPGGGTILTQAFVPVALTAGALLVASFVFNHFSDAGVTMLRPIRASLFTVLAAALLLWALTAPRTGLVSRFFRSAPMVFLGKYSYGLYVYHHFLSYYFVTHRTELTLTRWLGNHTAAVALQSLFGIVASILVAWLSYEIFEKRFIALKRFWTPDTVARQSPETAYPAPVDSARCRACRPS